jgi:hypothetical protein
MHRKKQELAKSVVATAGKISRSFRSGCPFSAVPHFKRSELASSVSDRETVDVRQI